MIETHRLADDQVLIIGAGLAGLFLALKRAPGRSVVISPAPLGHASSSAWAQGGLAAALGPQDNPGLHAADTIKVGAGLVDPTAAQLLAEHGPARVRDLLALGVPFDHDDAGQLVLSLEAAHSQARVARVGGDRAGLAIMEALIARARAEPAIEIREGLLLRGLLQDANRACAGALVSGADGRATAIIARETVLATGGIGGLFRVTTNPVSAVGAGLACGHAIGAQLAGLEFVQFHPTAIDVGVDPAPLATEALRGEGCVLIDRSGRRFMADYHPDGDLAARDVVARAIEAERSAGRGAFLDCRSAVGAHFPQAFATVFEGCMKAGLDPRTSPIPVAPAAHYHMGGLVSDLWGRTTVEGLSAVGECAMTGAHGANRLASNSLLEAVVFADRIAQRLSRDMAPPPGPIEPPALSPDLPAEAFARLRGVMSDAAGVRRSGDGLIAAIAAVDGLLDAHGPTHALSTARLVLVSALARRESRGAHWRADYPQTEDHARQSYVPEGTR
jgi:L-aspartate oxidase